MFIRTEATNPYDCRFWSLKIIRTGQRALLHSVVKHHQDARDASVPMGQ
jgi:hypothetical protein